MPGSVLFFFLFPAVALPTPIACRGHFSLLHGDSQKHQLFLVPSAYFIFVSYFAPGGPASLWLHERVCMCMCVHTCVLMYLCADCAHVLMCVHVCQLCTHDW